MVSAAKATIHNRLPMKSLKELVSTIPNTMCARLALGVFSLVKHYTLCGAHVRTTAAMVPVWRCALRAVLAAA
eukprot:329073-Amphidinium_carterae.1